MSTWMITDTSLAVSRVIDAPRERGYRALTDTSSRHTKHSVPDQAPGGPMELTFVRTEPAREPGPYRVTITADEGPAEWYHADESEMPPEMQDKGGA